MTRTTSQKIPPLKEITKNIPNPWDSIITEILSCPLKFPRQPTEGEMSLILLRVRAWEIALHWVIKMEWNTKHKIPAPSSIVKLYKPKGDSLRHILLMCERCHTMPELLPSGTVPYPHAAYWFGLVFWELIMNEIASAFTLQERENQERIKQQLKVDPNNQALLKLEHQKTFRKKETVLQERTDEVMLLQVRYENPLTEDSGMIATFRLMEAATTLAQTSDVFRVKYWKPFLNSYKKETAAMSKQDWGRATLDPEDNKAYVQVGQGKNRQKISVPEGWEKMISGMLSQ